MPSRFFPKNHSSVLLHCKSALYADDFKFIGDVSTPEDRRLMQADLDAVARWSADNKLPISFQKYFALYYGKNNTKQQYSVHGSVIKSTSSCADLGVLRCDDFSYDQHIHNVALKASRLSGMSLKLFSTRDQQFLTRVFTAFIRPIVEYASCVWSPSSVSASTELEKVQQRFTKRINGMSNLQYEQRLDSLQLDTLAHRRHISDLILAFKCLHGNVSVLPESLGLQLSDAPTRSFGIRLKHFKPASKLLASSFQCRVPIQWNNLPDRVLKCRSLSAFKVALSKHFGEILAK